MEEHRAALSPHRIQVYGGTNHETAKHVSVQIVRAADSQPSRSQWSDFYVPPQGHVIEDMDIFQAHCVMYVAPLNCIYHWLTCLQPIALSIRGHVGTTAAQK